MLERDLVKKQEELDLLKYNQSFIAKTDLSGKMPVCKNCMFKTELPHCAMNHETRQLYTVCARQFYKLEKEEQNDKSTIQPRKTRNRSNG